MKNEYREADTPIDPLLAEFLLDWKRKTEFAREEDWIFASPFTAGECSYFSTAVRRKDPLGWPKGLPRASVNRRANQDSKALV